MSRHQMIRNLDFQEELDEYDGLEAEEFGAEDQALMKESTALVRTALGDEVSKVSTEQIEEALWHYYYDVDKSVTYLVAKFVAPRSGPSTKASQGPKREYLQNPAPLIQLSPDLHKRTRGLDKASVTRAPSPQRSLTYSQAGGMMFGNGSMLLRSRRPFHDIFPDIEWGNVPEHRKGTLIAPTLQGGGLLGGSGTPPRMTRLQQLAASRKKKSLQKTSVSVDQNREDSDLLSVTTNRQELKNIAQEKALISCPVDKFQCREENEPFSGGFALRTKTIGPSASDQSHTTVEVDQDVAKPLVPKESRDSAHLATNGVTEPEHFAVEKPAHEPAHPSAFAQILFGSSSKRERPQTGYFLVESVAKRQKPLTDLFSLPYPTLPSFSLDAFSKPSPDEIVLTAQAKAGKGAPAKKESSAETVAGDMKSLKIEAAPLTKTKNLDVLSEFKRSNRKKAASFVVVGHVDAGKSTMMGRLLLDLNVIDQRKVDKLQKEADRMGKSSFALAWVLDARSDERVHGVTIDIATNHFETDKTAFTILDAPGHRDFISNMIAGASQADFAILVIDASIGAFESGLKGQTKEHSLLLRSMGVARVVVAINKLDTVAWSQERFDEIKYQVSGFLTTTGFRMQSIAFVPVSGLQGDNMVRKVSDPAASWYKGSTLLEELENSEPTTRALNQPLRVAISSIGDTLQSPLSVSGRVDAGSLQVGDALLVQPSGVKAFVKSLLVDKVPTEWAVAGQILNIGLSHNEPVQVRVGDIICSPANPVLCMDTLTLKVLAFEFLLPMPIELHRGRLNMPARIQKLNAILDKTTGAIVKKKPSVIKPAMVARVVVKLDVKIPLESGQRIVLRSGGQTIAAGMLE